MAAQILSDRIILTVADAEVTIFLFGATVTSWKAKGQERLFASNKTSYAGPKAIRAGIPLVFPQFGPGKLPQHGFARVSTWSFLGIEVKNDAQVTVSFGLLPDQIPAEQRKLWPFDFSLKYSVTLLNDSLKCALTTRNTGDVQFQFDTLLHTYFKISDISQLKVKGLLGFVCHDTIAKTDIVQAADPIVTKEMDVVYHDVHGVLSVNDIQIEKHNFADVVVWNPFNDAVLDTNEYKSMICVEVGNVRHLPLAAGQSYESWQVLTCQ